MAVDTRYVTHDKWTSLVATEVTYPDGRQVVSGYDALYRRNAVNETSGGGSIAAWQFFGNRTAKVALGNGITCSFMNDAQTNSAVQSSVALPAWGDKTTDRLGYDGSGRMIAKRFLPSGSTTALVGFTTAYDPSSNKLFERALHAESRSSLYPGYDSMDRLLEYQRGTLAGGGGSVVTPITLPGTDSQRTYDLDGLGNWKNTVYTPEGGSPTTEIRQHNKLNEITRFATTPVLYDHGNNASSGNPLVAQRGNGNIVNDGTRIYAYDALNRLVTVKSTGGGTPQVAAYTYDALGRRVIKAVTNGGIVGTIADATYRYLFDGQQIVEELLDSSGSYSTLRQFAWGRYIDELIQLYVPSTTTTPPLTAGTYYPLQDLLYRTTATTNNSGSIVEAYDFDAYGNTLMYNGPGTDGLWFTNDDVTTLQPMCENLFTGRQYDPETEIYWYRARYYLPVLGRFGGRDPVDYIEGPNLYLLMDPIFAMDPLGMGPAASQPSIQPNLTLTTRTIRAAEGQNCGKWLPWQIQWNLSAPAQGNGWIVQEVHVVIAPEPCDCGDTASAKRDRDHCKDDLVYWEAWPVTTNGSTVSTDFLQYAAHSRNLQFWQLIPGPDRHAETTDSIGNAVTCGMCNKGEISISTTAAFYQGLNLPTSWTLNNPKTHARGIPSTTEKPSLPQPTSAPISRTFNASFDCCKGLAKTEQIQVTPP